MRGQGLDGTSGLAVSSDGRKVYATGFLDHSQVGFTVLPLFADGFEGGDAGAWSAVVD